MEGWSSSGRPQCVRQRATAGQVCGVVHRGWVAGRSRRWAQGQRESFDPPRLTRNPPTHPTTSPTLQGGTREMASRSPSPTPGGGSGASGAAGGAAGAAGAAGLLNPSGRHVFNTGRKTREVPRAPGTLLAWRRAEAVQPHAQHLLTSHPLPPYPVYCRGWRARRHGSPCSNDCCPWRGSRCTGGTAGSAAAPREHALHARRRGARGAVGSHGCWWCG